MKIKEAFILGNPRGILAIYDKRIFVYKGFLFHTNNIISEYITYV